MYLRRSDKSNADKPIRSIEDQEADNWKVAEKWQLKVVEVIVEIESAREPHKRPKFTKILRNLTYKSPQKRKADGILSWHPNRLSRNAEEAWLIIQRIDDGLIKNLFFSAYSFHNDASWKEHLFIEFARAKWYNDQLSHAVSRWIRSRELSWAMASYKKYGYDQLREFDDPSLCSLFPIPKPDTFPLVKRMFKLALEWFWSDTIKEKLTIEFPHVKSLCKSAVDKKLQDRFYCWEWIICKGKENERMIDLNSLKAPDWTKFHSAISPDQFDLVQSIRQGNRTSLNRRNRINPLSKILKCDECYGLMYPAYRKIKKAWWVKEEQLWYECHSKNCSQSRIKADILFDQIETALSNISGKFTKTEYQKYLIAIDHFTQKKSKELKSKKGKISKSLSKMKAERSELIKQRAILLSKGLYDNLTRDELEPRIEQLTKLMEATQAEWSDLNMTSDECILRFKKFLELSRNLDLYWKTVNLEKKAIFSKIAFLNLHVRGTKLANLSVKKPIFKAENGQNISLVQRKEFHLNLKKPLCFEEIWDFITSENGTLFEEEFDQLYSEISDIKLKFPIASNKA